MRNTYVNALTKRAQIDESINLICGDLGFSVLEPFRDACSKQFLNAGIAEQNMTGVAAGMALMGKKVFTYSIANFPIFRCLEQIRNDVCYHSLDVNIISIGAGFSYGTAGYSHFGIEDVAVMKSLPNMTILNPANKREVNACLDFICQTATPSYTRIAKGPGATVDIDLSIDLTKKALIQVSEGDDIVVLTSGVLLEVALKANELLQKQGVSIKIFSCPLLHPFPVDELEEVLLGSKVLISIEDTVKSSFSDVILPLIENRNIVYETMCVTEQAFTEAGDQEYLLSKNNLTAVHLVELVTACAT